MEKLGEFCILDKDKKREITGLAPYEIPNRSQLNRVIMKTSTKVANIPVWQNLSLENLPNESWKSIKENKDYMISNLGRVKSTKRYRKNRYSNRLVKERILRQRITKRGYLQIILNYQERKYKSFLVHRLVAGSFLVKDCKNLKEVHHIDENKTNNLSTNLKWVSSFENHHATKRFRNNQGMFKSAQLMER